MGLIISHLIAFSLGGTLSLLIMAIMMVSGEDRHDDE